MFDCLFLQSFFPIYDKRQHWESSPQFILFILVFGIQFAQAADKRLGFNHKLGNRMVCHLIMLIGSLTCRREWIAVQGGS
jgi:hypothetical protein